MVSPIFYYYLFEIFVFCATQWKALPSLQPGCGLQLLRSKGRAKQEQSKSTVGRVKKEEYRSVKKEYRYHSLLDDHNRSKANTKQEYSRRSKEGVVKKQVAKKEYHSRLN